MPDTERRKGAKVHKWLGVLDIVVGILLVTVATLLLLSILDVKQNRRDSATDTCELFVNLARTAGSANQETVKRTNRFIAETILHDCHAYGNAVVNGTAFKVKHHAR